MSTGQLGMAGNQAVFGFKFRSILHYDNKNGDKKGNVSI